LIQLLVGWRSISFLEDLVRWIEGAEQPEHPLFVRLVAAHVLGQSLVERSRLSILVSVVLNAASQEINQVVGSRGIQAWNELNILQERAVALLIVDFKQELLRAHLVLQWREEVAIGHKSPVQVRSLLAELLDFLF